ncbi:MAG: DUF3667 domain-containing protein [Bacteroidetes bacterium]|jgi:hypothetical protein|nr:DUF3667 domain-containing protein [Bacteroidota bacterium]
MQTCLNCQRPVIVEGQYCHHCGAKIVRQRLTFRSLLAQLGQTVFNVDTGIWRTIGQLCYAPGKVCRGYIQGVRKRYLMPIAYLFFIASLYGLAILLSKGEVRYFHEDFALGFISHSEPGIEEEEVARQLRPLALTFILLSIPFLAFISRLVYRRAGYNYTEHLVVSVYYMGQLLLFNLGFNLAQVALPASKESVVVNSIFILVFVGYAWWMHIPTFRPRGGWKLFSPLLFMTMMLIVLGLTYGWGAELLLDATVEAE